MSRAKIRIFAVLALLFIGVQVRSADRQVHSDYPEKQIYAHGGPYADPAYSDAVQMFYKINQQKIRAAAEHIVNGKSFHANADKDQNNKEKS